MKEALISKTLQAYGVDLTRLPGNATITPCWDRAEGRVTGIYVQTFCYDQDGEILIDNLAKRAVILNVFHPEP